MVKTNMSIDDIVGRITFPNSPSHILLYDQCIPLIQCQKPILYSSHTAQCACRVQLTTTCVLENEIIQVSRLEILYFARIL